MSPGIADARPAPLAAAETLRVVAELGTRIRDERRRRGLTLREVAERAQVSLAAVQKVESGGRGSIEMYVRIAVALDRGLEVALTEDASSDGPPQAIDVGPVGADIVHAAMGEYEVSTLATHGFRLGVDEPWQHYRFSGRADVVGWDPRLRALLHIENRTLFPDVQDSAGRYNGKKAFLAAANLGATGDERAAGHRDARHGRPLVDGGDRGAAPQPGHLRGDLSRPTGRLPRLVGGEATKAGCQLFPGPARSVRERLAVALRDPPEGPRRGPVADLGVRRRCRDGAGRLRSPAAVGCPPIVRGSRPIAAIVR